MSFQHYLRMILVCMQIFFCVACVKVEDEFQEKPVDPNQPADQNILTSSHHSAIRFEPLDEPNRYVAYFTIPAHAKRVFKKVKNEIIDIHCDLKSQTCEDRQVDHGNIYEVYFSSENIMTNSTSRQSQIIKMFSVQAPQDLVVDQEVIITKLFPETEKSNQSILLNEYRRLFLMVKGKLVTKGKDITLQVEQIISHGGEILSFFSHDQAALGERGKNGGKLKIVATEAFGKMLITMRGQKGGIGLDGEPWLERAPQGKAGRKAEYIGCSCNVKPANGEDGAKGKKGRSGQQGLAGGNSGEVEVQIKNNQTFDLQTNLEAGVGGEGGIGGSGQLGGLGGSAGGNHDGSLEFCVSIVTCAQAQAGAVGAQGESGDNGQAGLLGEKQKACVQFAEQPQVCQ